MLTDQMNLHILQEEMQRILLNFTDVCEFRGNETMLCSRA